MVSTLLLQSGGTSWDVRSVVSNPVFTLFLCFFTVGWLAIVLLPFGKLLRRTGHHAAWCLLFIVPFVNLIALWVFAFKRWPTDKANS
jgi:hypothetical protein